MTSAVTSVDTVERDRIIRECQNFFGVAWQTFITISDDQLKYNGKIYEIILKGKDDRQITEFSIHFKQNVRIPKPGSQIEYKDTDPIETILLVKTVSELDSPPFDLQVRVILSGTAAAVVLSEFFDKAQFPEYIQTFEKKKEEAKAKAKANEEKRRRVRELESQRISKRTASIVLTAVREKMLVNIRRDLDQVIQSLSSTPGYSELENKHGILMQGSSEALAKALAEINVAHLRSKLTPPTPNSETFNLLKLPPSMHF